MASKKEEGNLLDMLDMFDVVLHGANCFHTFGAGIALQFKNRYPQTYAADLEQTEHGDRSKLGTYSKSRAGNTDILNCYTQFGCGGGVCHFDYDAFASCLIRVKSEYSGKRIGMPMIGSALAGGDWARISGIIDDVLDGEDVTVVVYSGK